MAYIAVMQHQRGLFGANRETIHVTTPKKEKRMQEQGWETVFRIRGYNMSPVFNLEEENAEVS